MAFQELTLDDQHAFLVALFANLFPDKDVSQGSFNWLWLRTLSAGVTDNHSHIDSVKTDLLPFSALADTLQDWATFSGVVPNGETPANAPTALRVFGTATTAVPDATPLVYTSGLRFQTVGADVVGPNEFVDVGVTAVDVGTVTNLDAGQQLTFVSTPPGLQEVAVLQVDLTNGTDEEGDGSLQLRVSNRWSSPALGGAANDYVQWAIAQTPTGIASTTAAPTGIAAAYAYPLRAGRGSVDVAALHPGSGVVRLLEAPEVAALQAIMNTLRPVTATVRVLLVTSQIVDGDLQVTPDGAPQNEFWWDDTTPPTVLAWTALTRTLQFSAARPTTMLPGMTLWILPAAGGGTGLEYTIEALVSTDSVILQQTPATNPATGDTVFSGGPLVQPVRAAVQALFDSLGTANPDAIRYGTWEGNLRPGALYRAALGVPGVLDSLPLNPTVTVEAIDPVFPNDTTTSLLIAGRISVRRSH